MGMGREKWVRARALSFAVAGSLHARPEHIQLDQENRETSMHVWRMRTKGNIPPFIAEAEEVGWSQRWSGAFPFFVIILAKLNEPAIYYLELINSLPCRMGCHLACWISSLRMAIYFSITHSGFPISGSGMACPFQFMDHYSKLCPAALAIALLYS